MLFNVRSYQGKQMAMKQKESHRRHGTDENGSSTISTTNSSYDTTEDLSDTDTSSQHKNSRNKKRLSKTSSNSNLNKVRFAMKDNAVHEIESHDDFTSKERSKYWWSDREKDRMMAKHERLVAKYEQQRATTKPGTTKKPNSVKLGSYRGLESWTSAGSMRLDQTIEQCITAVMDEQDRQWEEDDDDADVIAEKSAAVTADSARRARLNGLQDAQEALKSRAEQWLNKSGSEEMSVASGISTGTASIAKKKKRSKLLARLDDSYNRTKSYDDNDSLKKSSSKKKKGKKKKKDKKKKSGDKNTASSSSRASSFDTIDQESWRTTNTTQPTTAASQTCEQERPSMDARDTTVSSVTNVANNPTPSNSSLLAGVPVPVSPLSTHITSNTSDNDEYPLLTALRRQSEQLRQGSRGLHDDKRASILHHLQASITEDEDDNDDDTDDVSPLLQTLRAQQKKQASSWQNEQQVDPDYDGNGEIPSSSSGPDGKLASFRGDQNRPTESGSGTFADPPGRRPRRLASRHVGVQRGRSKANEKTRARSRSRSNDGAKGTGEPGTSTPALANPEANKLNSSFLGEGIKLRTSLNSPSESARRSLEVIRNGAKKLLKKGSKK